MGVLMQQKLIYIIPAVLIIIITSISASNLTSTKINERKILANAPGLNPDALAYAVKGYQWAVKNRHVDKKHILTVVDFTKPSSDKRLWVINLHSSKILMNTLTTQGKNSGVTMATSFSNTNNSKKSSLGVFKTLNDYQGKHGLSMRLKGLEKGINDNAFDRAIVVHPANYATPSFVKKFDRTGRSWGCFAVNPAISKKLVKLTKGGSVIFAYSHQEKADPNLV